MLIAVSRAHWLSNTSSRTSAAKHATSENLAKRHALFALAVHNNCLLADEQLIIQMTVLTDCA